jgi:hypothetical protein
MPVDELGNKFYRYAIYMYPEYKDNIDEVMNNFEKNEMIKFLSEDYIFIKKNIDKLMSSYRILFIKYHMLSRLVNPEEKEFRKELNDRVNFINNCANCLMDKEYSEDWSRYNEMVNDTLSDMGIDFWRNGLRERRMFDFIKTSIGREFKRSLTSEEVKQMHKKFSEHDGDIYDGVMSIF